MVRTIIDEEMLQAPNFATRDGAFSQRFATTKGGSHSNHGSIIAKEYMSPLPEGEITRRNFVEALHTNPLLRLPPDTWVSRSSKLEHGKSRALFACDSINYMHFDAPCRAIERTWLNRNCIIAPGSGFDAHDLSERLKHAGRYKLMLDYADFNSAHTLRAQQIVVSELFRYLNHEWRDWLVESFNRIKVRDLDGE